MKPRSYKLVMEVVGLIINLLRTVNINKSTILKYEGYLQRANTRIQEYSIQYEDKEYMKTLSPIEQQCLMENTRTIYTFHEQVRKDLDYLDMTKHTQFLTHAIGTLERVFIITEALYKEEECGDIITPHLSCIKLKQFPEAAYQNQINSLYSELEEFTHDLLFDHMDNKTSILDALSFHRAAMIHILLTEATAWLNKEQERLSTEGIPETRKLEFPEEKIPEVPTAPDNIDHTL